jgi:hypothetical protein
VPDFGKSEGVANNTAAILDSPEEYPHQGDNDDERKAQSKKGV